MPLYLIRLHEEDGLAITDEVVAESADIMQSVFADDRQAVLVCECDGVIVGHLFVALLPNQWEQGSRLECYALFVAPDHRFAGAMQSLLREAVQYAREHEASSLRFTERPGDCPRLLERLGATPCSVEYEVTL